jgi:hypothetical protein
MGRFMVQDNLADTMVALTPIIALVTILIWLGALILHYSIKKSLTNISSAQSAQDLSRFRCETVAKRMKMLGLIHKFFLIITILLTINYAFGLILRYSLLHKGTLVNIGSYQTALYIVRPVAILGLLQCLGAIAITKTVKGYFTTLMNKCKKFDLIKSVNYAVS